MDSKAGLERAAVVAVIGSGTMGAGIAQVAALAGHDVLLFDAREGAAAAACRSIESSLRTLLDKGRITAEKLQASGKFTAVSALADLRPAALVVEAIVEDLEVKQRLFQELEAIVTPQAILATNTSSLSITAVAAKTAQPHRVAGFHFFNPAPVMALVEIVSGIATGEDVVRTLLATATAWGKKPVCVKSTPGFIVNRVARPFYAEALRVLEERGADPATLDAVFRESGAFRMGPFELMDLIGHDVNFAVTSSMFSACFYDRRFLPSLLQKELVSAGWYGRKTGRGFYCYGPGSARPEPSTYPEQQRVQAVHVEGSLGVAEPLVELLRGAGVDVSRSSGAGYIRLPGATLALADGRTATMRVADGAPDDLVQFDLAFDYCKAGRVAVAKANQANSVALDRAAALFQTLGKAVSVIADVPGMILMRTLVMLANEAAETVTQGVASQEGVDLAMKHGVNYPAGPLEWVARLGSPLILAVLHNLQQCYGDDRYRAALFWRQAVASQARRSANDPHRDGVVS